ncbi:MAG: alpha/beta fold hydrolase [Nitriliruptorales bacterium]|nr:alpha/beta fold hydrolase [Nitriliruptorales bacterium]
MARDHPAGAPVTAPTVTQVRANERVDFSVRVHGSGPGLLYLHGFGGLACGDFLDLLGRSHTVYAPEMPGVGGSTGLDEVRSTWELALAYHDLLQLLDLPEVAVVGHSVGGMIAAELAALWPSSVNRLALVSPMGLFVESSPGDDPFALLPTEWCQFFADQDSTVARRFADPDGSIDERVTLLVDRATAAEAAAKFLFPIPDRGLSRRLYRVTAPTLLAAGGLDTFVPAGVVEAFRSGIPHAQVSTVPEAGHMLPLEEPVQLSKILDAFLGSVVPARHPAAEGGARA